MRRGKIERRRTAVPQGATWRDIAKLKRKVDRHTEQIDELFEISTADRKTQRLQDEGIVLLKQLGKNHSQRITLLERQLPRIRRLIAKRNRQ